jgi:hypothetical protein
MAIEADVVQEDDCRRLVREAGACSSASDFITGAAIPVDGGYWKSEIGLPAPPRP